MALRGADDVEQRQQLLRLAAGFAALRANRPQGAPAAARRRNTSQSAVLPMPRSPFRITTLLEPAHVFERFRQHRQFAIAIQEQAMGSVARGRRTGMRPSGTKA